MDDGLRRVIVTLGANGALYAGPEGMTHVPAFAVQPVDTTGAGDCFVGGFLAALQRGFSYKEAARFANPCAEQNLIASRGGHFVIDFVS